MALPNYVKFQRGTLASYNRLSRKDDDTLYFIYDANDNSRGSLYLGSRLIGEVGGSGGVNNLSELTDVLISAASAGDFLVLNSEGKWINVPASDVASRILEAGGSFLSIDENEFLFNSVNGKLELKGYSSASNGMMPVKSATGIVWQTPAPDLSSRVGNLESGLFQAQSDISNIQTELQGVDGKIATAIGNLNHLEYQVIQDLSSATASNVVYLYNNGSSDPSNRYDEFMLINGSLESLGSMSVDLSDYMTASEVQTALNGKADASDLASLDTRVGNLESLSTTVTNLVSTVSELSTTVTSLVTTVSNLQNSLTNDYVLTTTFNAVVGDLTNINGTYNNLVTGASVEDNLIEIYERLTWQEISE